MKKFRILLATFAAVAMLGATALAQTPTQTDVVATPQNVTLTPNTDGSLAVQFVSSLSCGEARCVLADSVIVERNGVDMPPLKSGIDVSMTGDGMGIKTNLAPDQWKRGDCFRIRQSAPPDATSSKPLYSDYSAKVCV